jgi:cysteine desulfurase
MLPWFTEWYGNPSSLHALGRKSATALTTSRRSLAQAIGAQPSEIIFTSGGSESDNAALRGIARAQRARTGASTIVTTAIEHKAVLATAEDLREHDGFSLEILGVDSNGLIRPDDLAQILSTRSVALVSVMLANNEIGTVQPLAEVAEICKRHGVPLHSDAVQAMGKLPVNVAYLGIDALSGGAHKFYGPKGVGFLYLRAGIPFWPVATGGSHEAGRRAGTENIPLIVGMAKALESVEQGRVHEMARLNIMRDRLIRGVTETVPGARLTGSPEQRLDNHASFVFEGTEAEGILIALDLAGVAASSGSACTSASQRPSHVLEAIGVSHRNAAGGLRFSLGFSNTMQDIDYVLQLLPQIVNRARGNI